MIVSLRNLQPLKKLVRKFRSSFEAATSAFPLEALFVFSSRKRMQSTLFNQWNVQSFRAKFAYDLLLKRRTRFRGNLPVELIEQFETQGYLKIETAIASDFELVRADCKRALDDHPLRETMDAAGARYTLLRLRAETLEDYPHLKKFLDSSTVKLMIKIAQFNQGQKVTFEGLTLQLHRVATIETAEYDENQKLHVDTFHSSTKGWLYLDDVKPEDGPFCYFSGSNVTNQWRLEFEKRNSKIPRLNGSWRISDGEAVSQFGEEINFCVPKNTLVVADTKGIHRRGWARKGVCRDSIHFSVRQNPFW